MAKDLVLDLDSHERVMSTMARTLAAAGINIEGTTGPMNQGELGVGHVLVEDVAGARAALEAAGIRVVAEMEVAVIGLEDRPGSLSELLQKIGPRSYDLVYMATGNRIVLGGTGIEEVVALLRADSPAPGA